MMWRRFRRNPEARPADVDPARDRALEAAYERGRADGRREERVRRSHPVRNLMVGVVALAGGAVLAVAAWYGSFGREAIGEAGVAVREAGRDLQTAPGDRADDQNL